MHLVGSESKIKKTAVVLFNLGGPLSKRDIEPFLISLFSDPAIITLPNPLRYVFARLLARKRLKEAHYIYAQLGGKSPLLRNTSDQAAALETELGEGYKVFCAMRHAAPFIQTVFHKVRNYGPDEVILLPLFPQYSTTTTESFFKEWKRLTRRWYIPTRFIYDYPDQNGFIEGMAELTLPLYRKASKLGIPRVLLTAHGLPEKIIKKGDPYQYQVEQTAKNLIEKLGIPPMHVVLCYQSRVGPLKWLGPSITNEILKAAQENHPIVIVPLSFVSEHAETLVELDITYRELALQAGCPVYYRVGTVQTHPSFIKGLASLVKEQMNSISPSYIHLTRKCTFFYEKGSFSRKRKLREKLNKFRLLNWIFTFERMTPDAHYKRNLQI